MTAAIRNPINDATCSPPARARGQKCPLFCAAVGAILACSLLGTERAQGEVVAADSFEYAVGLLAGQRGGAGWAEADGWKTTPGDFPHLDDTGLNYGAAGESHIGRGRATTIYGTGARNNPLRRQLREPFTGEALFVRFLLKYDAKSIDNQGPQGDGEFVVLWLDDIDGGDGADHNPNVPTIGILPSPRGDKNCFMVRMDTKHIFFSDVALEGDRVHMLVARLSKSRSDALAAYDRFELWVDPAHADRPPDAVALGRSFNTVRWVGFATGKKTEPEDAIQIDELVVGESWEDVAPWTGSKPAVAEDSPSPSPAPPTATVDFRRDVYPILRKRCFECHQGRDAQAGYRLDVREEILGHYQGKALAVPGDSQNSITYQVLVTEDEDVRMPLGYDPLPAKEVSVIQAWIDQGLSWDEKLLPSQPPETDHWAFQPIRRPVVPKAADGAVIHNPIDAFISAQHAALGIVPPALADRSTLLRRLTLDLTGLPPAPKDVAAFVADESPDAYERAVERLLGSEQYGERWARHWLDLARWAESDGYQQNAARPNAWRYRDYVIRSFAQNKRYDRFLREQIAGDEIAPASDENLIATGFLAAARYSGNELDKTIQRNEILVDIANTTSNAVLGLTMQCAQCHSHKFDPISARDYYRFLGFFVKGQPQDLLLKRDQQDSAEWTELLRGIEEQHETLAVTRARLEASRRQKGLPDGLTQSNLLGSIPSAAKPRFKEVNGLVEKYESTWGFYSPVTAAAPAAAPLVGKTAPLPYSLAEFQRAEPVLLVGGDVNSPGPRVDVGWPAIFGPVSNGSPVKTRPRTALVEWLTSRDNPLTARVWVNRLWQYHFGRGLVPTPDDFGTQGEPPTHPELLDWLAAELIESGWDTGHIQRLIVASSTYQQSSASSAQNERIDPENRLYWRWKPRRLEAEAIRDSMLAVAGLLDRKIGGPSVPLKEREASTRRTIYLEQKRGELPFIQQLFDAPTALMCCGQRRNSTVALQPLFLLNDPTTARYAEAFADRVAGAAGDRIDEQVRQATMLALGRPPDSEERALFTQFLRGDEGASAGTTNETQRERLVLLCHALLNLNEFLYIP